MRKRIKKLILVLMSIPIFMIGCSKVNMKDVDKELHEIIKLNIGNVSVITEEFKEHENIKRHQDIYTKIEDGVSIYDKIIVNHYNKPECIKIEATLNGTELKSINFLTWFDDLCKAAGIDIKEYNYKFSTYTNVYNLAIKKANNNVSKTPDGRLVGWQGINMDMKKNYKLYGYVELDFDNNKTKVLFSLGHEDLNEKLKEFN